MNAEPNEVVEMDAESIIDNAMDSHFNGEQETPSDSSTEKETTAVETEETEDAGADQPQKANPEESKEETEEGADPKDLMFRKGYNEAKSKAEKERQALEEKLAKFSDFESKLERFEKVTSSPEYVKAQMRQEGYREEVINAKLKEMGHSVDEPAQDDVKLVLKELGVSEDQITPELKNTISDIAKIVDIISRDRINKTVPDQIKGVESRLNEITQASKANEIIETMQKVVKNEGILDFDKDILPALDKYTLDNPEATQQDVLNAFKDLNHKLTIERLRLGKNKEARNESKAANKGIQEGQASTPGKIGVYKGDKPIEDFIDDVLDSHKVGW